MQEPSSECANCDSRAGSIEEYSLQLTERDGRRVDLTIPLCEPCASSLLELDWVAQPEPVAPEGE